MLDKRITTILNIELPVYFENDTILLEKGMYIDGCKFSFEPSKFPVAMAMMPWLEKAEKVVVAVYKDHGGDIRRVGYPVMYSALINAEGSKIHSEEEAINFAKIEVCKFFELEDTEFQYEFEIYRSKVIV